MVRGLRRGRLGAVLEVGEYSLQYLLAGGVAGVVVDAGEVEGEEHGATGIQALLGDVLDARIVARDDADIRPPERQVDGLERSLTVCAAVRVVAGNRAQPGNPNPTS